MSKTSKKGNAMKNLVTIVIVTLAIVGGINVYNSKSFQTLKNNIVHNDTVQAINDIFGEVTHTDSTK